jgi:SAM-dependent methyltransferase
MITNTIKNFLSKNTPGFYSALRKLRFINNLFRNQKQIFSEYYSNNYWDNEDSRSGPGSDIKQTQKLIDDLPGILKKYQIKSMMDAPCGDFFWMKHVDLNGIDYLGTDIVDELIKRNNNKFGKPGIHFKVIDLIDDTIPKVDLIFCRDLLVHLPDHKVSKVLKNFVASGSSYLLTTDFKGDFKNIDIAMGDWRPLNLEKAPFNLPAPLYKYQEDSTLGQGKYPDKYLSLWKLSDLNL